MRVPLPALLRTAPRARLQTRAEEMANAASHALACALPLMAWPALAAAAPRHNGALGVAAVAVFCITMVLVFLASAVYHALPHGRAKRWFNRLDHAAIFLFIAGSFTPFALKNFDATTGQLAFAGVWLLALAGIGAKARGRLACPLRSTALYVALGWVATAAAWPVLDLLTLQQLLLIGAGGAAYMVGAVFFLIDHRLRYSHFIWHLFVLAGSGCHFTAALA